MAITFIYPVKVTGGSSLDYDTENKDARIEKEKNDSRDSLEYVMRDKKGNTYKLSSEYMEKMRDYISRDENGKVTFHTTTTYLNCGKDNTYKEWEQTRKFKNPQNGMSGNLQYCIVQNFGIDLDPKIANEIGVEFAKKYLPDYQCVVSTHINTGHVHNHIEFNATSFVTGKKFNDDLKAIGDIRKISDDLCKQYELDVLEHTKDFNFVVYRDGNGKVKVYEPTERKNQITEGEFANKNDYRNTEQYRTSLEHTESHTEILRKDIDRLIPYAASYEDLLQQLKNAGYEIKDKTKSGDWRKHISFKAPGWDAFTRDSSLGEGYEREFLTRTILSDVKKEKVQEVVAENNSHVNDVKESDIYVYGRIVIEDIDEDFRYRKKKNDYEKVRRSTIEKYIITDTKQLNREVNVTIRQAMYPKRERVQELASGSKRQQYLIDRINSNLKTLRFVEEKEIRSFQQINDIVKVLYEKRNACYEQLNMIGAALKRANADIVLMDNYNALRETIEVNAESPDYALYEKDNDVALLSAYEKALKEKGLLSREQQEGFKQKYEKYNNTFKQLSGALEKVNNDLRQYDDCIYNLNAVDKSNGNRYASEIAAYYEEKKEYQSTKKKNERGR